MSEDKNTVTTLIAIEYAKANINPVLDKLGTLSASTTTQNKLLAYHVFKTCLLAKQEGGEKITHKGLENILDRPFDKRVSSKGRKVADYVLQAKPVNGVVYTENQFHGKEPELHVMTIYGVIAAYEKEQRDTKKDKKSCVEQALTALGLPAESAQKQLDLADKGNDAAQAFVASAMAKYEPIRPEPAPSEAPATMSPSETLAAAQETLFAMVDNGELEKAQEWLAEMNELFNPAISDSESESATLAA